MGVGRRQVLFGGFGIGIAVVAAGPRLAAARDEAETRSGFSTYGIVPAGGEIHQTATLQLAADEAAESGTPLFLPAGVYSTGRLSLKSGTQIEGVPGRSILRYRQGGAIIGLDGVENVTLAGSSTAKASRSAKAARCSLQLGPSISIFPIAASSAAARTARFCGKCRAGQEMRVRQYPQMRLVQQGCRRAPDRQQSCA